jgi:hypothetical protein
LDVELTIDRVLSGDATTDFALDGDLTIDRNLSGNGVGEFDATASLTVTTGIDLAGNSVGELNLDAELLVDRVLSGAVVGEFVIGATLDVVIELSGSAIGEFAVDADVSLTRNLGGHGNGVFSLSAELTVERALSAFASGEFDVSATLDVIAGILATHYVGELGRYRLYEGVFAEDYSLFDGMLSTYTRYIGSLHILNEEGIVIEKAIIGQTIAPKFALSIGADHGGSFSEPNTVTIKFRWGDGTEETFTTDDDVALDGSNPGVYYVSKLAATEGTATIYALAEWNIPVWAVAKNKRVEVVGEFEV